MKFCRRKRSVFWRSFIKKKGDAHKKKVMKSMTLKVVVTVHPFR